MVSGVDAAPSARASRNRTWRAAGRRWALATCTLLLATSCDRPAPSTAAALDATAGAAADYSVVDGLIDAHLRDQLSEVVAVETWRGAGRSEAETAAALQQVYQKIVGWAEEYARRELDNVTIRSFAWPPEDEAAADGKYRVYGLRIGDGEKRRISVISHLDTVPPGEAEWAPFTLTDARRPYLGKRGQEFWVGRGALDDKGPALVGLNALLAAAEHFDRQAGDPLAETTLELLLDTSEETGMSFPHYLEANPQLEPTIGVVFDAMWCVRAEKGIERPIFTLAVTTAPPADGSLYMKGLATSEGASNQIADSATLVIGGRKSDLHELARAADGLYLDGAGRVFDDPDYRRAHMVVDESRIDGDGELVMIATVAGAQHGSAPDENRDHGANPLVSLANFAAFLVEDGQLVENEVGRMARFVRWAWGTRVFGEHHPDLLYKFDEVFTEGNGTTYAVTKLGTVPGESGGPPKVQLEIDVRYAIPHHQKVWDGKHQGLLPGSSIFGKSDDRGRPAVFPTLLAEFESWLAGNSAPLPATGPIAAIEATTSTSFGPDIRIPEENEAYQVVSRAFEKVTGTRCTPLAIGGGTDAKGHLNLVAAGALFTEYLGPPVNFHGIGEGAPVHDLRTDARILYQLFVDQGGGAAGD